VGGFNQALRTLIPESIAGTVDAARDEHVNVGVEQKLWRGTYLAAQGNMFTSDVHREIGVFKRLDDDPNMPIVPAATTETLRYTERGLLLTANQLLGAGWSIGSVYSLTKAKLHEALPDEINRAASGFHTLVRNKTASSTSGVLQEIRVQNGATVTSGQILAVLAPGLPSDALQSDLARLEQGDLAEAAETWAALLTAGPATAASLSAVQAKLTREMRAAGPSAGAVVRVVRDRPDTKPVRVIHVLRQLHAEGEEVDARTVRRVIDAECPAAKRPGPFGSHETEVVADRNRIG